MANKESDGKRGIGQSGQGNTSTTQDPTQGYGVEKEPMDLVKPQRDRMAYQGATERPEDRKPRSEIDGSKSPPRTNGDSQATPRNAGNPGQRVIGRRH